MAKSAIFNSTTAQGSSILTPGELWQVPVFLLGMAALAATWLTRPYWYDPYQIHFSRALAQARAVVDTPLLPADETVASLKEVQGYASSHPRRNGELHFLLGSAYERLAERASGDKAQGYWREACTYLVKARELGVPPTDENLLKYRLAKGRFHAGATGASLVEVIQDLHATFDGLGEDRWEGWEIVTQSFLKLNDISNALMANDAQLALPVRDERLLGAARWLRGELLLKVGQREEARKVLDRIDPRETPGLARQARYLRARSYQEDQAWEEAAKLWQLILDDTTAPVLDRGQVLYDLAICYEHLGRMKDAEPIWQQAAAQGGAHGTAALLHLGALRVEARRFKDAVAPYKQALARVNRPEDYACPLMPLAQVRATLEPACRAAASTGDFESAYELARCYSKVASYEAGVLMLAKISEDRARHTKAAEHYLEAGRKFEQAAESQLGTGPQQAGLLWSAAQNYLAGKDYSRAISTINRSLSLNKPNDRAQSDQGPPQSWSNWSRPASTKQAIERLSEAWYHLGEAYLAQLDATNAELYWKKCVELRGPFANRAAVQLALLQKQKNELTRAVETLGTVLNPTEQAGVEQQTLEDATYILAGIHFQQGNYQRAAQHWEQALDRFSTSPRALDARFQLGECYLRLADAGPLKQDPNPAVRPFLNREFDNWLTNATRSFERLIGELEKRRAAGEKLSAHEQDLLRQSLMVLGDCSLRKGQFASAAGIYDRIAVEYQRHVDALIALQKLYTCQLNVTPPEKDKAALTLSRFKLILEEMPDGAFKDELPSRRRAAFEDWFQKADENLKRL